MAVVALVRCCSYDERDVLQAVGKGFDLVGGVSAYARKGERILLKPNMLAADPPERCVTTHPAVLKAVAQQVMDAGAKVQYGDSPAIGNLKAAVRKTGMEAVARELNLTLADFIAGQAVFFEDGHQNRKFTIARGALESDGLISLPKLKTHGLERLTGCVKNQFGCVPGFLKGECHVKIPDAEEFAKLLVDLNACIHPRLYIMDGIWAMQGNGPRGGTPKSLNVLLFSTDPVALDATVCRIICLDPNFVPTIRYGAQFGMGVAQESEIELIGEPLESFITSDFDVERAPVKPFKAKRLHRFINNRLLAKPFIRKEICIYCGTCVNMCPTTPKAVNWLDGDKARPPVYDYRACIRCYCCQELCPEGAVELKVPQLRRVINHFTGWQ